MIHRPLVDIADLEVYLHFYPSWENNPFCNGYQRRFENFLIVLAVDGIMFHILDTRSLQQQNITNLEIKTMEHKYT